METLTRYFEASIGAWGPKLGYSPEMLDLYNNLTHRLVGVQYLIRKVRMLYNPFAYIPSTYWIFDYYKCE